MEHVSTLCAISTVGIAATGFALGRVDRAPSRLAQSPGSTIPFRDRRAPSPDTHVAPSPKHPVPRLPTSFLTAEAESPAITGFSDSRDNGTLCADPTEVAYSRRKTSFPNVRLRRRGQTLTALPLRIDENPPASSHGRRPSSSWIRRLSFQPDKRCSVQTPVTPSFPEPASPASSRPSSQRKVPNKLVKRPKSQHSNANSLFAHDPSTPLSPTVLRRPATSYQRSGALRHKATHSLSFEPSLATHSPAEPSTPGTSLDGTWRPYIAPVLDALPERPARRFSTTTRPKEQTLRRILPHFDIAPALLLATSITRKEPVAEATPNEPATIPPVEFRDPFKPADTAPPQQLETASPETSYDSHADEPCPKSPINSEAPLDIRVFRNGSFVGPKRRAASTPLPGLTNVEGAIWVSPRASGRRNITDPNVFRRPPATFQPGLPGELTSAVMGSRRKIVPSYYREYSTELGQFRDSSALSSLQGSLRRRPKRHSLAASDPASTVIGSDDTRIFTSGDEDETDFLTDTAFDSIRTHITSSSHCLHSPRIENIFDHNFPPDITDKQHTGLRDIFPPSSFAHQSLNPGEANAGASSIPGLAVVTRNLADADEGDSHVSFPSDLSDDEDCQSLVASLPGEKSSRVSLPRLQTVSLKGHSGGYTGRDVLIAPERPEVPLDLRESVEHDSNSIMSEARDSSPKMNIFDWSEQSRNDREGSGPDGRPSTVHGKHGAGMLRGSRTTGRKPPSTMHYRSQSVPVAREPINSNEARPTSGKFGTWGLGSKGVSEDWDSDFEFEDMDESGISETINSNKNTSRRSMVVPEAIMERQASLHGQFGQVQELTLLVEELKRLRHQASFLNIVRGPSSELWKEAEGIVDLATLDDDEHNHSPPRSPSSLTFSFDDSEGESSNMNDPWKRVSGDSWRASLSEHSSSTRPTTSPGPDPKGLSSKANSVLDMIYHQRLSHDPTFIDSHLPRSKKLPFDTQSLRDLVVRAGVVTRALKEVIRKAESVTNGSDENTHHPHPHPPFSRIFEQPSRDDLASKFETSCIGRDV
ncbi:hypothetical protein P175DRAFT_0535411 [Aspergillus ochraceoroseus IBT 24754]|uniref:Uncharacterized protein n=2 Tax=Aspergillus ochraceoroseus TaxID=138278 RepID=A0A2T5LN19_9EURO|nr:uncharacterized protein P175DRAFT_0535411 [Aspergillus ochraceoroseus IBT 24754]KKK23669.1 hypothetical protein AOCH_002072 [Aspergillus ochraceoroseus]PTU17667.1 hypothetical protein P175DRAFT_0535411 [Aspergillus ochraceoroseus IBT 24754]